jgi:rare lipoprotein A (peptidoglycan hydrolase)
VGSSGRHRVARGPKFLPITLLAVTTLIAVAAVAVAATRPARTDAPPALADAHRVPDRASRGDQRTPIPTPEPTDTPSPTPSPKAKRPHHRTVVLSHGACEASYYGSGGRTASGETFDRAALTAAHRTLPLGSKVKVTNRNNDRSVVVRINDRGPFVAGRCLDLSVAAMHAVGGVGSGVIPVSYEVIRRL